MRRHLLILLTVAILLPSFAALVIAAAGVIEHQKAMEVVAQSYVKDLAQNFADRIEAGWETRMGFSRMERMMRFNRMSFGLSIPGWVAVVDSNGRLLFSTSGTDILTTLWQQEIPIGSAVDVKSSGGERFTLAAYPAGETGWFVIAAVSWNELLGPMLSFNRWPLYVGLTGLLGLLSVYALWRWLVSPLRVLEAEVSVLKWGKEVPVRDDNQAVFEIRRLRQVLYQLALSAVERANLMKRYVSDIVKVQEEERSKLAREIHDGPLQDVTALIQQLRLAKPELNREESADRLHLAEEGAINVVRELRSLCDELSPPWLDLGLAQALQELADRFSRYLDISVSVEVDGEIPLSREETLAFFRVVQEAVHNSARHGNADSVVIRFFEEDGKAVLEIVDDGKGFDVKMDVESLRVSGHRGLANMNERMSLIGGTLEIKSAPGEGATVRCSVPITSASA
ncbi:MAG TPA: sensor histidine kinase [Synergistaceae bacterium]|nr:sensor histidine kinase [Synergistaceae bacterium]